MLNSRNKLMKILQNSALPDACTLVEQKRRPTDSGEGRALTREHLEYRDHSRVPSTSLKNGNTFNTTLTGMSANVVVGRRS
jgi:hypothetical protein